MKKRLKCLLNKKGFTLVEVLVVLIVSSILILCATGMMRPVNGLLNTTKADAHLDAVNDTVNEYIRRTIQNAKYLNIISKSDVDTALPTYSAIASTPNANLKINALAVLKKTDSDGVDRYRLFEFEDVTNTSVFNNPDDDTYGVFKPAFYENASYMLTFSADADTVTPDGEASYNTANWLKITSIFVKDNKPTSQEKSLMFKVLGVNENKVNYGGATTLNYKNASGEIDAASVSAYGDGIIILYMVTDFDNIPLTK